MDVNTWMAGFIPVQLELFQDSRLELASDDIDHAPRPEQKTLAVFSTFRILL